jgi:hypothetical protein
MVVPEILVGASYTKYSSFFCCFDGVFEDPIKINSDKIINKLFTTNWLVVFFKGR